VKPVDHLPDRVAVSVYFRAWNAADQRHGENADREQDGAERVGRGGLPVVEKAAERRADDQADLPGDRAQRDRLWEELGRDEVGGERAESGAGESAGDAERRPTARRA
jgi:hypothetical protein